MEELHDLRSSRLSETVAFMGRGRVEAQSWNPNSLNPKSNV